MRPGPCSASAPDERPPVSVSRPPRIVLAMNRPGQHHVTVIGAGIVGTVCASYLLREGHAVTMIDREEPGEMTSFGNTGGISPGSVVPIAMPGMIRDIPKWLFDPLGPLH